jgi:hypothetical protein
MPSSIKVHEAIGMRRPWRCLAAIVGLLFLVGPVAIRWRIWTIVVNAVNCVLRRWARPHVSIECREVVLPRLAYCNPPPAIRLVLVIFRVKTALFHESPHIVFRWLTKPVRDMVLALIAQTSTRPCIATNKNNEWFAAVTHGIPIPFKSNIVGWALQRQAAHAFAFSVSWLRSCFHVRSYITNIQPRQVY